MPKKILIPILVCTSALLMACERKGKSSGGSTTAPPPKAPPTEESKGQTNGGTTGGQTTSAPAPAPSPGSQTPATPQQQGSITPRSDIPGPAESSPTLPSRDVARLDQSLPEVSALDTFGGLLLTSYLKGEITGEQAISQVFDHDELVMSNLAEMSVAVRELRTRNEYSTQDQEKVLVLEGAMTQYLNEKLRNDQQLATALEYGTAAALGLVGGIYSTEIIRALQRLTSAPAVQGGLRNIYSVYESAKGSPAAISAWLSRHWPSTGTATAASTKGAASATEATVQKSSELYRRTVGFVNAPADHGERERTVFNYIYRVINSPDLVKGYRVTSLTANQTEEVSKLNYFATGIPGFRINQVEGRDYLIAQLVTRSGDFEYYRITGLGIKAVTRGGDEMVVPPEAMTGLISHRMRSWGQRTSDILGSAARRTRDTITQSRPYQYVSSDPFARRLAEGAAVGIPISALTLLTLKPVDLTYLTLDDYVRDLNADGINVDRFIDVQKAKTASGR